MTHEAIAREMARPFFDEWCLQVLGWPVTAPKKGRPRLFIPSRHREQYPRWRRYHGAATARKMAGVA